MYIARKEKKENVDILESPRGHHCLIGGSDRRQSSSQKGVGSEVKKTLAKGVLRLSCTFNRAASSPFSGEDGSIYQRWPLL
jgi:hypothetical protein